MLALAGRARGRCDQNLDLAGSADEDAGRGRALGAQPHHLAGRPAPAGGINTANLARAASAAAPAPSARIRTTQVQHGAGLDPNAGGRVQRTGNSGKASRAREEVEIVFDRNKGALYALYGRALRDQPELAGKLVLEFTIAPSGEITMCRVVSSELNDPELEKKIVARVRLIRFKPADVEPLTVSKPIDFFPAA